jgi:hypothetical protein
MSASGFECLVERLNSGEWTADDYFGAVEKRVAGTLGQTSSPSPSSTLRLRTVSSSRDAAN